ncbi:MAG TPA: nuclear transport factor 2 family protein [Actinomycetota bacterium]|nr:nuclear transport factor 2 family protein [Actinomycetota bacterium]
MTPSDATRWLREYAAAWERGDVALHLYTPDATYRSHPFREPHVGHGGIRAYGAGATSTQSDVSVRVGDALVDGNAVVAEWWTVMVDEGSAVTLPGVLLLELDGERCVSLREYWAIADGRHEPHAEWGRFERGDEGRRHAEAWVEEYGRAWRAGDADAAAATYSPDVVFRSHPFREATRGRAAVRSYTERAFASETDRTVWLGRPFAAGASAAVEYWATFTEDGTPKTLAGCVLMSFDRSGAVRASRDYWHEADGTYSPPAFADRLATG